MIVAFRTAYRRGHKVVRGPCLTSGALLKGLACRARSGQPFSCVSSEKSVHHPRDTKMASHLRHGEFVGSLDCGTTYVPRAFVPSSV